MIVLVSEKTELNRYVESLCAEVLDEYKIDPHYYEGDAVKRGLRNADGTGVMAGVTRIGSVQGYYLRDMEKIPIPGELFYRGISVSEIVDSHAATGTFGWRYSAAYLAVGWQRAGAVLVATLLAFGLVRVLVRKLVNGALAQPSDALFGCLVGLATGAAVVVAWGYLGLGLEYSALASEVARHVGP